MIDKNVLDIPEEEMRSNDYAEGPNGEMYKRIGSSDYYISSEGRVISLKQKKARVMRPWHNQHGHEMLRLPGASPNKRGFSTVHRLVAEAFVPNPNGYSVVRHLDDDPTNNDYRNLAWGSQADNIRDSIANGGFFTKKVYCFETDKVYSSCADAARELNVYKSIVTLCCQGKVGTGNGYHFCYYDEIDEKRADPNWLRVRNHFKPIIAISPSGKRIRYSSRKEAAEDLGIPDCGISSVINGHLKHTHGWRFEEG